VLKEVSPHDNLSNATTQKSVYRENEGSVCTLTLRGMKKNNKPPISRAFQQLLAPDDSMTKLQKPEIINAI
jgi:hypothetical protein